METYEIGKHLVQVEEDTIFCFLRGDCHLPDAQGYFRIAESVMAKHGRCFLVSDVTQMTTVSPDIRRFVTDWFRGHTVGGCAVAGANLPTRAVVTLLVRAVNLLGKSQLHMKFVGSADEARTAIAAWR